MDRGEPKEVREALEELEQYLADSVPPLLVADSVRLLMVGPARLLAQHLISWAAATGAADPGELGEPLGKALTRIYQLADLQLVPKDDMRRFLSQFEPVLLDACPVDARGKVRSVFAQFLARGPEFAKQARTPGLELRSSLQELDAFSDNLAPHLVPLLEQMARTLINEPKTGSTATGQEIVSQLLAAVTRTADSPQQLEERLEKLKSIGLNTDVPSVLRTLGGSIPNWAVVPAPEPSDLTLPGQPQKIDAFPDYSDTRLRAMQRIVELGRAPEDSQERFGHMLETAVEQFNLGAVGRAVSILKSARELVSKDRIPSTQANPLWDQAAQKIQWRRFEVSLPDPVQHQLLRQFLTFFSVLSPLNLLNELRRKEAKTGRRLLISLLQIYGAAARPDAWKRLEFTLEEEAEPDWEFAKDVVGLLASIPLQEGTVPDEEVKLLTRMASLPVPLSAFRELVRYATQMEVERGKELLTTLLEPPPAAAAKRRAALEGGQGSQWSMSFEQILTHLAGSKDPSVHRLVVKYCLSTDELINVSTAPLAVLGTRDLATEPDTVARLMALLKRQLPFRWTAWFRKPKEYPLLDLVQALSGTSSSQVRALLSQVARRFPNRSFGIAAIKADKSASQPVSEAEEVAKTEDQATTAAVAPDILLLEGELHSFNLPSLIQHLEATCATGVLELLNSAELVEGTATFVRGQLFHCQAGHLRNKEALYALLEKPVFGRFRLKGSTPAEPAPESADDMAAKPLPVVPTLLEGIKRYDEYQQLRLLVPDDTVFAPTGERPGRPEGEDDSEFVRQVWAEAVFGKTAAQCEASIAADPYRTRRLLAYWLADGVLRQVSAANVRRVEAS